MSTSVDTRALKFLLACNMAITINLTLDVLPDIMNSASDYLGEPFG